MSYIWIVVVLWSLPLGFQKRGCPFCDPIIIAKQQFYEDAYVRGLENAKPIVQGHRLIVPKRHVERFEQLSDQELLAVKKLIVGLKIPSYWILQKNGLMQSVPHVHFHLLPKPKMLQ